LFLLLDSREARWLPSVLANKYDKACITVGLGFDSFVIVRHGVSPDIYDQSTSFDLFRKAWGKIVLLFLQRYCYAPKYHERQDIRSDVYCN
jgi:hypothetical protein